MISMATTQKKRRYSKRRSPQRLQVTVKEFLKEHKISRYALAMAMGVKTGHLTPLFKTDANPTLGLLESTCDGLFKLLGQPVSINEIIRPRSTTPVRCTKPPYGLEKSDIENAKMAFKGTPKEKLFLKFIAVVQHAYPVDLYKQLGTFNRKKGRTSKTGRRQKLEIKDIKSVLPNIAEALELVSEYDKFRLKIEKEMKLKGIDSRRAGENKMLLDYLPKIVDGETPDYLIQRVRKWKRLLELRESLPKLFATLEPAIKRSQELLKDENAASFHLKVCSLFAGAGGFDYGFHKTKGFEIVFVNEINDGPCETYLYNFPELASVHKKGDIAELIDKIPPFDVLIGGFPCQDFSLSGNRKGFEGKTGNLFNYCSKALSKYKPCFFFLENVEGILSQSQESKENEGESEEILNFMLNELVKCGYKVIYQKIDMTDYAVPQRRHRVIFFGVRDDIALHPKRLIPSKMGWSPEAPKYLKDILRTASSLSDHPNYNDVVKSSESYLKKMKNVPEGKNLKAVFKEVSQEDIAARRKELGLPPGDKAPTYQQSYNRLKRDDIAPTMCFGNSNVPFHPIENRTISVLEAALIQSFPKTFVFRGTNKWKQVGNCVPPKFSLALAENLMEQMTLTRIGKLLRRRIAQQKI